MKFETLSDDFLMNDVNNLVAVFVLRVAYVDKLRRRITTKR